MIKRNSIIWKAEEEKYKIRKVKISTKVYLERESKK